jgi:hypothetical protein
LKLVSLHVPATGLLASLLFLAVSTIPVYADANPNNHGHHYGQLKHPKASPVPIPSPAPIPTPASTPAPVNHPAIVPASDGAAPALASTVPGPVSSPAPVTKVPVADKLRAVPAVVPDPVWWLLLTILPLLFAAWLIAFRRLMLGAGLRLRPATRMATAGAEA